jgi:hypothetical protein
MLKLEPEEIPLIPIQGNTFTQKWGGYVKAVRKRLWMTRGLGQAGEANLGRLAPLEL